MMILADVLLLLAAILVLAARLIMDIEDIFAIIEDCHAEGDPDTPDGITGICNNICSILNDCRVNDNWWTEDAMLCIAEAAYQVGLRQS